MSLVSIVTVTHESYRCLERLRATLKMHTPEPHEWIIVDNASARPETASLLADLELTGDAKVIRSPVNAMFTKATNTGIAASSGDPIVLLNPDCAVTPGWLGALLDVAASPQVGIVGNIQLNDKGNVVHAGGTGDNSHVACLEKYRPDAVWAQTRRHGEWVTGACLLVKRKALDAAGGKLNERYKHYYSDRFLCEDVRRAGFEVWICGHPIVHVVAGSGR